MDDKLASSKALGYGGIFISFWMISLYNTQWYMPLTGHANLILALVIGGAAVAVAGFIAYLRGETYEGTLFLGFGTFAFSSSLAEILTTGSITSAYGGWLFIVWTVFFLYIWISVLKKDLLVMLFMLGLWLTFLDQAIAIWMGSAVCQYVGGYIGLVTAALAACIGALELWQGNNGSNQTETSQTAEASW